MSFSTIFVSRLYLDAVRLVHEASLPHLLSIRISVLVDERLRGQFSMVFSVAIYEDEQRVTDSD
jgi:hypothetical protein